MVKTPDPAVAERRDKVLQYIRSSVYSPKLIAKELKEDPETIRQDIRWLQDKANDWLNGMAKGGFIFDVQIACEQLEQLETELVAMKQDKDLMTKHPGLKLKIIGMLQQGYGLRIEMKRKGPLLMKLRQVQKLIESGKMVTNETR